MLLFFEYVIKYSIYSDAYLEILYYICYNANNFMTISKFTNLFKQDSKFVVCKISMHFSLQNLTCYKYNTCKFKVYKFNFPQFILLKLQINYNRII